MAALVEIGQTEGYEEFQACCCPDCGGPPDREPLPDDARGRIAALVEGLSPGERRGIVRTVLAYMAQARIDANPDLSLDEAQALVREDLLDLLDVDDSSEATEAVETIDAGFVQLRRWAIAKPLRSRGRPAASIRPVFALGRQARPRGRRPRTARVTRAGPGGDSSDPDLEPPPASGESTEA